MCNQKGLFFSVLFLLYYHIKLIYVEILCELIESLLTSPLTLWMCSIYQCKHNGKYDQNQVTKRKAEQFGEGNLNLCFCKGTFDGNGKKMKSVLSLDAQTLTLKSFYIACTDSFNISLSQRIRQVLTLVSSDTNVVIYLLLEAVSLALCFPWQHVYKLWKSVCSIPILYNGIQGECLAVWHLQSRKHTREVWQGKQTSK